MSFQIAILQLDDAGNVVTYHYPKELKANVTAVVKRDIGRFSGKDAVVEAVGAAFDEVERELALRSTGVEPQPI